MPIRVARGRQIIHGKAVWGEDTVISPGSVPDGDLAVWLSDGTVEEFVGQAVYRDDGGKFSTEDYDVDGMPEAVEAADGGHQPCPRCGASGDAVCVSVNSGKPLKRAHRERA